MDLFRDLDIADMMRDQDMTILSVSWRWVNSECGQDMEKGWMKYPVPADFTVKQLYHVINLMFDDMADYARHLVRFRTNSRPGLEFKVSFALGKQCFVTTADEVKMIFDMSLLPARNGFRRKPFARACLLDSMRGQSARQVALETALL